MANVIVIREILLSGGQDCAETYRLNTQFYNNNCVSQSVTLVSLSPIGGIYLRNGKQQATVAELINYMQVTSVDHFGPPRGSQWHNGPAT